ncbi:cation:proton antiporter [Liberiplasma polymorphum]|uniref:cation:proton antiporter n=1 Tax=Liberiplasma polymorphum TaxID=3374570 RepID=UPI0037756D0F
MMLSLAYIIIFGMSGYIVFKKIKLPGAIGMLIAGVIIGPYGLNLLDDSILLISLDLRKIALIVILIRAGLGIDRKSLQAVGKQSVSLSIIPVLIEGFTIVLLAVLLLDFRFIEAGLLGFIIAAVSPAIVVPSMLKLIKEKIGMQKNIPVLVLASVSIDDVIAITIFSTFLSMYLATQVNVFTQILWIPISIGLGIIVGLIVGFGLIWLFNKFHIRDTKKVLLLISIGIMMMSFAELIEDYILIASLLGVMTMGIVIVERKIVLAERLAVKFNKVWVFVELTLFVLVGAAVNIQVAFNTGLIGIFIILAGLFMRSLGVLIATLMSDFSLKERLFLVVSFLPKATVQAAIGGIPLALGVANGEIILALAVLSIIISAPIGAIGIDTLSKPLLKETV